MAQITETDSRRRTGHHGARWLDKLMALARFLVGLVMVGVALWLAISFPLWWADAPRPPLPLSVAVDQVRDLVTLDGTAAGLEELRIGEVRGDLEVKFGSPWTQWLYIFFGLQEIVLVFLIVAVMRRIVASIARGEAFGADNARRLRLAGLLFIIEAIYAPGISAFLTARILDDVAVTGGRLLIDWTSEIGQNGFVTGWVLLILSEVFRQGAEMRAEQSLTV